MFTRIRLGWELTKKSWAVVRSHPKLVRYPITGAAFALLAMVIFGVPGVVLLNADKTPATVGGVLLVAVGFYLASFALIFFNVVLAAAADQVLTGHEPDGKDAMAVARGRLGAIAAWAAVSAIVSGLFALLRSRGGAAGQIGAGIGAALWTLITFMVIPVLAFENIGPIAAIKRSSSLFKRRWGQQVAGNVTIGGIGGLAMFVGIIIGAIGVAVMSGGKAAGTDALGAVLLIVGVLITVTAAMFVGATKGVFGVVLYRYVAEDKVVGSFTPEELHGVARTA